MVQQLVVPAEYPLQARTIQITQGGQIPKIHIKLQKWHIRNDLISPQATTPARRQQGHHRATLVHAIAPCEPQGKDDLRLQEGKGEGLDPHQQANPIAPARIPRSASRPAEIQPQPTPNGFRHLQERILAQERSQLH